MPYPDMIGLVPQRGAALFGRKTAVVFRNRRLGYDALEAAVGRLSRVLRAAGHRSADRVALFLENRPEYLVAYFAVPRAGGVSVPLNLFLAPAEVRSILQDSGTSTLIVSAETAARIGPSLRDLPALRRVLVCGGAAAMESARAHLPPELSVAPVDPDGSTRVAAEDPGPDGAGGGPDDPAVIIYTSGTTGTPKGVMLSHRNLLSNARGCIEAVGVQPRDRIIVFLPMFHSFTQMVCLLAPVVAGMSIVLCEKIDRGEIRRAITRHRPTICPAVPAVFAAMAHARVGRLARWLNPVRLYISGGAPLSVEVLRSFEETYRRPLCEGYGLSEASPVVSLNPPAGKRIPGSVGLPLPGVEVRIVDTAGRPVPAGGTGELLIRGESVMKGYAGRPAETAAALADGWLRTGDLARRDQDGYLYIMGRIKEMLIYRGMNIYPREIEEVLESHPQVKEAAVIGVPDAARGEVPYAFVVPHDAVRPAESELRRFCAENLARYKVPRGFRIVEGLPRNASGKILKQDLRVETAIQPSG